MKDIQSEIDNRNITIDKVGVKELKLPLIVLDRDNNTQKVEAVVDIYVEVASNCRGTHFSRFTEVLEQYGNKSIDLKTCLSILQTVINNLNAKSAYLTLSFNYFIKKQSPISQRESYVYYPCKFIASIVNGSYSTVLEVTIPYTSLCPCSKEISEYGAHNQRSYAIIRIATDPLTIFWIEDVVKITEKCASSPIYNILKREDEKYVTEQAYNNPRFVEDMVREISLRLDGDKRILWYEVSCEHHESIHQFVAFANLRRVNDANKTNK